ncbi:MAG: chaperonin GroEL [Planctomycetota bacterium]|nr:chaperonin GroEL [Planctomycetota bacterium]
MVKELTFEDEAREKLLSGAHKLARAVRTTLGPRGRSAVIDRSWGGPRVSKDGATVAEEVELEDRVENIGARLIREAGTLTARDAGDGSTTATVLAEAVFRRGMRQVMAGENPVLLQRALLSCTDRICKKLEALSEPIEYQDSILSVASIAANNDDRIGKTIASALDKVGNDGVCTIEEGKGIETTLDVEEGLYFDRGYISQQFVANPDSAEIQLENPFILILEEKVSNLAQLVPVLEKVVEKRKPLLIIAEDIDGEALTTLVVNSQRGVLQVAAVKAPGYGDRRKAMLQDIAIATGGRAIFSDLGIDPGSIQISDLGTAKKIEINSQMTTIVNGGGKKSDMEERCRVIRLEIEAASSDYDREKLQERLARLIGGIAVIRVGGSTEGEVKERKKRFENSLAATRSALEAGILPGGGVALIHCADEVARMKVRDPLERVAAQILADALEEPFRQLARNSGVEPSILLREIRASEDTTTGYDFARLEMRDLMETGIIDSCDVIRRALQNAVSSATMILTSDAVITEIPSEAADEDHHHDHEGAGAF